MSVTPCPLFSQYLAAKGKRRTISMTHPKGRRLGRISNKKTPFQIPKAQLRIALNQSEPAASEVR